MSESEEEEDIKRPIMHKRVSTRMQFDIDHDCYHSSSRNQASLLLALHSHQKMTSLLLVPMIPIPDTKDNRSANIYGLSVEDENSPIMSS